MVVHDIDAAAPDTQAEFIAAVGAAVMDVKGPAS